DFGLYANATDHGRFVGHVEVPVLNGQPIVGQYGDDARLQTRRAGNASKEGVKLNDGDIVTRLDPEPMIPRDQQIVDICVSGKRPGKPADGIEMTGVFRQEALDGFELSDAFRDFAISILEFLRSQRLSDPF